MIGLPRACLASLIACLSCFSAAEAAVIRYVYDYEVTSVYLQEKDGFSEFSVGDSGKFKFRVDPDKGEFCLDDRCLNNQGSWANFAIQSYNYNTTFELRSFGASDRNFSVSLGEEQGYMSITYGFQSITEFLLTKPTIHVDDRLVVLDGAVVSENTVVPLPASAALLGSAVLGALALRRRRRAAR